jgi:hypothetical protein
VTVRRTAAWAALVVMVLGPAAGGQAQPLEIETPKKPQPQSVPSPDRDIRPMQPVIPTEPPAYMRSLSDETRSRRMGVAAWTTTNPPVGSLGAASPESRGSAGFGFAVEWF